MIARTAASGIAKTERALGDRRQRLGALLGARRLAQNMQAVRDERVFELEDRGAELVDFVARAPPQAGSGWARSMAAACDWMSSASRPRSWSASGSLVR